jgi:hypothetical protein
MPFNVRLGKRHNMRFLLYPSHLPDVEGKYVAKTSNEAVLVRPDICASQRERGGFSGNIDEFLANLALFMDEVAYQVCDGFAVNLGPCTIYPNVGGVFNSEFEEITPETHPVSFRCRINDEMRKLVPYIDATNGGIAPSKARIETFTDTATGAVNSRLTSGGPCVITGDLIKIAGDGSGLYLWSPGIPSITARVQGNLIENTPGKIAAVIPAGLPTGREWAVEIHTRYSHSSAPLKELRIIRSEFLLAVAPAPQQEEVVSEDGA